MILQEQYQTDLNNEFNSIFTEIEASENILFIVNYVQLDRDKLDESFTKGECLSYYEKKIKLRILALIMYLY